MKYNIRKYILAGITAILAAAVLTACGGSKPEKDDTEYTGNICNGYIYVAYCIWQQFRGSSK